MNFEWILSIKHFEEKRFCWKVYKVVDTFGLCAEEGFTLRRKLRARSVKSTFSVSWGTIGRESFFEEHVDFAIISELWDEKLEFSDFFPAELWKLHFSCPGNILKRNNLPQKQSCSIFSESEQQKTLILARNHRQDCQNCVLRFRQCDENNFDRNKTFPIKFALWANKNCTRAIFMKPVFFLSRKHFEQKSNCWKFYSFFHHFWFLCGDNFELSEYLGQISKTAFLFSS